MERVASSKVLAESGQSEIDLIVVSKVAKSHAGSIATVGGQRIASEEEKQERQDGRQLELHDVCVCCVWCLVGGWLLMMVWKSRR